MSYKSLLAHFESSQPHIPRNAVLAKVSELARVSSVRIVASSLDETICRGMYFAPRNNNHPLVQMLGHHVIVVCRGMNRCWTRFIIVKELMHLLDGAESATDTGEKFDRVLTEIGGSTVKQSAATNAEISAWWKALAVLCPERVRQDLLKEKELGHITDYGVALRLRIPEFYVPHLLSKDFPARIEAFLK